jgi:hypothetical protein
MGTIANNDNLYGVAAYIVDPTPGRGNFTTIQAAITAAAADGGSKTIFIRPSTYTENLTLSANVNLTAFQCDSSLNGTGKVIILGTCTLTAAGTVTISGIQLQTNSAALLAVTGSEASIVNLNNCYLNCTNNTGITFSSANTSAFINVFNCTGDLGTTGIALFSDSSTGRIKFANCFFSNSGNSTTASTKSAGSFNSTRTTFTNPLTYSSSDTTGGIEYTNFSCTNITALTTSGTGQLAIIYSYFSTGSASAISVGSGTILSLSFCILLSTNTNALTGAGTVSWWASFFSSSKISNVTTQLGGAATGLSQGTAPSAGFIGEQIRSAVSSASAVSLTNNTPADVTSISLTAGIWDISAIGQVGANGNNTEERIAISTTSATLSTSGDNTAIFNLANTGGTFPLCVPSWRLVVSSTTTVYLVARSLFSTGSSTVYGRISATRVG